MSFDFSEWSVTPVCDSSAHEASLCVIVGAFHQSMIHSFCLSTIETVYYTIYALHKYFPSGCLQTSASSMIQCTVTQYQPSYYHIVPPARSCISHVSVLAVLKKKTCLCFPPPIFFCHNLFLCWIKLLHLRLACSTSRSTSSLLTGLFAFLSASSFPCTPLWAGTQKRPGLPQLRSDCRQKWTVTNDYFHDGLISWLFCPLMDWLFGL